MRSFKDGDEIRIEPWRARAFPVVKDLVVDRSALDRIIAAGGFITRADRQRAGRERDPRSRRTTWTRAMDAAQCIGCGACVAACPNGSASLFTAAKITHLGLLPQGQPERYDRARAHGARRWTWRASAHCTLYGECQEACPKEISIDTITRMNRDFLRASLSAGRVGRGPIGLTRATLGSGARPGRGGRARSRPSGRPGSTWPGTPSPRSPRADPVPGGDGLAELRIVQPALMLQADGPARLSLLATLNLEGATIGEGELTPGAWGEGFVDRRHPHTYLHELLLTADDLLRRRRRHHPDLAHRGEGVRALRHRRPDDPAGPALSGEPPPGPDPGAGGGDRGGAPRAR